MVDSYEKIALKAIEIGFSKFNSSERKLYENKVVKFLHYYKNRYNNAFSEDFKKILDVKIIKSISELKDKVKFIIKGLSPLNKNLGNINIFYIYRLVNKEKQLVRIGKTGDYSHRLIRYLSKAFSNGKTSEDLANLHLDIRALGNRKKFNDKFEYQILYISESLEYIKTLERLFTIYENRYDNKMGFDLSINDYYNKIVGDLYDYIDGEFQKHHPYWIQISPGKLGAVIKTHLNWDDILKQFKNVDSITTIMRRAVSYGFTINGKGSLQDIRAFFLKPIIESCILKNYSPIQIINFLIKKGFVFLNQLSNTQRARRQWLVNMCNFIWQNEIYRIGYKTATIFRVRKLLLFNALLKVAKNPKFNTFFKAEAELRRRGIVLKSPKPPKNRGELYSLMKNLPLKQQQFSYKQEQNKILAHLFIELLRNKKPQLTIGDIAEKFGLDRNNHKNLIINIIIRIFNVFVPNSRSINEIREFLRKNTTFKEI